MQDLNNQIKWVFSKNQDYAAEVTIPYTLLRTLWR